MEAKNIIALPPREKVPEFIPHNRNLQKPNVTLNVQEAADLLGIHKETARSMAAAGKIPAVKIGRAWRFMYEDLVNYMHSQYSIPALQGVIERRNKKWHSSNAVKCGGLISATKEDEYVKALALPTN